MATQQYLFFPGDLLPSIQGRTPSRGSNVTPQYYFFPGELLPASREVALVEGKPEGEAIKDATKLVRPGVPDKRYQPLIANKSTPFLPIIVKRPDGFAE